MRHAIRSTALAVPIIVLAMLPTLIAARQGTPTPAGSVGVTGGPLGSGQPDAAPGHVLWLREGTFAPGGIVPRHHHPGALVLSIQSGSLVYTVYEGEAQVTRAATNGTPGPTERFGPGTETVLNAGDAVFEQGVTHTTRNDGDVPSDILIAALAVADEPFTQYEAEATAAA